MLGLHAFDEVANEGSGEQRVVALVLKGAAIAWLARQVDAATERHAVAFFAQLDADELAVFEGGLGIPGRGSGEIVGEGCRIASRGSAAGDTIRGVGHLNGGNAEARNGDGVACAAIGFRSAGLAEGKTIAMQERDFFVECEFFHDQVGAGIGRERRVGPWVVPGRFGSPPWLGRTMEWSDGDEGQNEAAQGAAGVLQQGHDKYPPLATSQPKRLRERDKRARTKSAGSDMSHR